MQNLSLLGAAILACSTGPGAVASEPYRPCLFAFASQPNTPKFESYPSIQPARHLTAPRLVSAEARRFRTAISNGAKGGVNFAGRYTIVGWGCGSSCLNWAVVDRVTGKVHFDRRYQIVSTVHVVDDAPGQQGKLNVTFNGLRFQSDSRLLIIQGAPNEDERQEGLIFLEWTGHDFRRLAFMPARILCPR